MERPLGQSGELSGGGFRLSRAGAVFDVDRHPPVPSQKVGRGREEMSGGGRSQARDRLEEQGGSGHRDGGAGPPERCAFHMGWSRRRVRQGTSLSASAG